MNTLDIPASKEYAGLFVKKLRELGDGRNWILDEIGQCLWTGPQDGEEAERGLINFGELYGAWSQLSSEAREEHLSAAAIGIMQRYIPDLLEQAKPNLLPIIRNSAERGQTIVMSKKGALTPVYRTLCDGLDIGLVYDSPYNIARLDGAQLSHWGLSEDEAFAIALENLHARSNTPMKELGPGTYVSDWDDYYDTSRLLLAAYMREQVAMGTPVIMVPGRDKLLLTSEANEAGLGLLMFHAEEAAGQPRAMPPLMLRLVDGRWTNFEPPAHAVKLNNLRKTAAGEEYENQKRFLQERLKNERRDIFVATYMVGKGAQGISISSACTWSRGVKALLPRADMVCFLDPHGNGADAITVYWEHAISIVGDLMRQTNDWPSRFFVNAFPDVDQLTLLKQFEITRKTVRDEPPVPAPPVPAFRAPSRTAAEAPLADWGRLAGMLICWLLAWTAARNFGAIGDRFFSALAFLGIFAFGALGIVYASGVYRAFQGRRK
ncbi:hypothetical protein AAKU55_002824 [Oxalobacteraceae bacterium GrIS 1.11]